MQLRAELTDLRTERIGTRARRCGVLTSPGRHDLVNEIRLTICCSTEHAQVARVDAVLSQSLRQDDDVA